MKAQEYCYWLKGWFQLSQTYTVEKEQLKLMKSHLDEVLKEDPVANPFCHTLNGVLLLSSHGVLDETQTSAIKDLLDKQLNIIHHKTPDLNQTTNHGFGLEPKMRC